MKMKRISAVLGIAVIVLFLTVVIARTRRAQADAAFIKAASLQMVTLTVEGVERQSLLHIPPSYNGKQVMPVVIVLHGGGGTAKAVAQETGWVAKADTAGFIVVFPEATRPDMSKPPKFGPNNPTWNDGSGRFHSGEKDTPDIAFVAALLDHLEAKFTIDKQRIFATGFSNGASMAFRIGLELSDRVAAIAPVAGALWIKEPKVNQPVSLYYITGTEDPLNPMEGGSPKMSIGFGFKKASEQAKPPVSESVQKWVKLLGCTPDSHSQDDMPKGVKTVVHDGGRDGTVVVFTTIEGHGHVWPGGKSLLPEFIVGKATSQLNATDTIWEFFRMHGR